MDMVWWLQLVQVHVQCIGASLAVDSVVSKKLSEVQ